MTPTSTAGALNGDVLSFQPWSQRAADAAKARAHVASDPPHTYMVQVKNAAMSRVLEAVMPLLDSLLQEKTTQVREQKLGEMVEFIAGQMVVPSSVDLQMAQRVAVRHARVLNEFGYATAGELADANQSRAANRHALADNWKKRRQVFAVRQPDAAGRAREVFPLFQFDGHQPIKAVQGVLEAFGESKSPWKLALWFTSNNGWLPAQARPVDLLASAPEAVVQAARSDAGGSAA